MLTGSARTCASCAWWSRQAPQLANATRDPSSPQDRGTCQLNAPVILQGEGTFPVSLFPVTHEDRFCGSWRILSGNGGPGGETIVPFPAAYAHRVAEAA